MERASRGLVRDPVFEASAEDRASERRRCRDGTNAVRSLLRRLREEVRLLARIVLVERAERDEHAGRQYFGWRVRLDDLGIAEHALERADTRLHQGLLVLGGVVLGVLADVAVLARRLQALGDVRPARRGELVELALQTLVRVERQRRGGLGPRFSRRTRCKLFGKFHGMRRAYQPAHRVNTRSSKPYCSEKKTFFTSVYRFTACIPISRPMPLCL